MKAKYFSLLALMVGFLLITTAASATMLIPNNDQAKDHAQAPEKSPVIDDDWGLTRVDFIHYAKPDGLPGKGPQENSCYKLMGVEWKALPVNYTINPTNADGLSKEFVTGAISTSAETWDTETAIELFNDSYQVDYSAQYGLQNFQNAIVFGNYPDSRVIAVTSVWYTNKGKQIVEFDMLFNDYFQWGDANYNPSVMDLQNIATHELGHGVGMNDIYSTTCSVVTMYGYSNYGETDKRTLEPPDIAGLEKMYGA